jgi:pSer/pThr/pTyr-binding forkhead associated (FHA) protein
MAKLVIQQSDGTTRDVVLDRDRISIGRRPDHDICLPFPAVSADHAEIVTVGADSFLHDLGSTNGTVVNGERVTKHFLRDHDRIEIGRQQLVYLPNESQVVERVSDGSLDNEMRIDAGIGHQIESASGEVGLAAREPQADIQGLAPVDELLSDLMHMESDAAVAVEMPPMVSVVEVSKRMRAEVAPTAPPHGTSGVFIEVMSGPNAGQITPMTKSEFVLGKAGATKAIIRHDVDQFLLIPRTGAACIVNGQKVPPEGTRFSFGELVEVAGVRLRLGRRRPL